ncbi:hypothetical protein B0H14DRAFT_2561878 [Mycena olivaceomarginata]|nr:hypothetical protein B0H14DRAFT_2561878 [Mycena olivaceomarginata]
MSTTQAPKKRGSASDFKGSCAQFLEQWADDYMEASRRKTLSKFWPRIFPQYWMNFSWQLALTEDPAGPLFVDKDPEWVAPVADKEALSEGDATRKSEVVTTIQKKIKSWFNHKRTALGLADPWQGFFKHLCRPEDPAPKRLADFQFYMQHPDFKNGVMEDFKAQHGDTPKKERLKVQCEIARARLETEPEEVKTRIRGEATAEYEALLAAHQSAKDCLPPMSEEERDTAREHMSSVVGPLLSTLSEYTGYNLTLLAGRVETDPKVDVKVVAINSGKTREGKTFSNWDVKTYSTTLQGFSHFVWAAYESELPGGNKDDSAVPNVPTPTEKAHDGAHSPSAPAPTPSAPAPTPSAPAPISTADETGIDRRPEFQSSLRRKLAAMPHSERYAQESLLQKIQNDADEADPPHPLTPEPFERDPFDGMKVLSPLRRKTIAKIANGSNLEYEVRQLRRLSSYELVRENNIAKNHETLVSLGLDKSFDEMMAMKRKPGEKKGGGQQAKRARKGDRGEYDGEDSDEEKEDEDATLAERIPRVQRAKPAAKSPAVKDWVKKAETNLEKDVFGPRRTELVSQWYLREQQNGFTKSHSAKLRPKEIGVWVQKARTGSPDIKDVARFANEWGKWWQDINPAWRKLEEETEEWREAADDVLGC